MKKGLSLLFVFAAMSFLVMGSGCGRFSKGRQATGPAVRVPLADRVLVFKNGLGLSAEQTKILETIREEYKKNVVKAQVLSREMNQSLRNMYLEERMDFIAIKKQIEKTTAAENELKLLRLDTEEKSYKTLTPEQQKKYFALMAERKKQSDERRKLIEARMRQNEKMRKTAVNK